jgi:DNA-binding transcriptional MerR regulator
MAVYSIKDLERLTGIKAHTIRIWEKRYQIVEPERTDSNIRTYCDNNLKKLLNISILNRSGIKISTLCKLSDDQIREKVLMSLKPETDFSSQIESMVVAMIELNEERFEWLLNQSITKIGFEETLFNIIYPFYEKVGLLWLTGTICPAQEHFISNLIRLKLSVAIDGLPSVTAPDAKRIILFLPEWEMHELGLLTYFYMARKQGLKVFYLGQNVPAADVYDLITTAKPDFLGLYLVVPTEEEVLKTYIQNLSAHFDNGTIFISGSQASAISDILPSNVTYVPGAIEFKKQFEYLNNHINVLN